MKKVTIHIPGMQSSHCMHKVKSATEHIDGVQIQDLTPGVLSVSLQSDELKTALISAIERAGYQVTPDDEAANTSCQSSCCVVKQ